MMPLSSGDVDCQHVSMLKTDILNLTYACKLLMRIFCQNFNAFIKTISALVLKVFADFA